MEKDKLQEAKNFYEERIKDWMINDLEKISQSNANFLIALGCLIYTEIIGIFLPPLVGENGKIEEKRFYRCFFRLPSSDHLNELEGYIIKETKKGIYKHLRHSMAHRYFPIISKKNEKITLFIPSIVAKDGLTPDGKKSAPPIFFDDKGRIVIAFKNYIRELKAIVNNSYNLTFIKNKKEYQLAAINGIDVVLKGKVEK